MDELQYHREALAKEGSSTETIDSLVAKIVSANSEEESLPLLEELEFEANKLDWPQDRDYAAVALQHAAALATPAIRKEMLKFALARAEWCASCGTAGGECLARARHINELEALLRAHA